MTTCQQFKDANRAWVDSLIASGRIPGGLKGVHFAFVHQYDKPGHGLHGQLCLVAGRERAGQYFNQFNFLGGKIEDRDGRCEAGRLLGASFRELWEEMGVCLVAPLSRVVVDIIIAGRSLIWVCVVTGLSSTSINKAIALKDKDPHLPSCYKEVHECRQITRGDLHKCSSYVQSYFGALELAYTHCRPARPLHFSEAMVPVYGKKHT